VPALVSLFVLAFAVSLDGFGVGMMYGLRKIKINLSALAIISCLSGVVIYTSMGIGVAVSSLLSPAVASHVGAIILIGIGMWALVQFFRQRKQAERDTTQPNPALTKEERESNQSDVEGPIWRLELRRLGLVIQILRTPSAADIDRSGTISPSEAILLGVALSLDAFGAGIGAALIGLNPIVTAITIAIASGCFIAAGLKFGLRFADMRWLKKLSALPGCVLIIMGCIKLFQ